MKRIKEKLRVVFFPDPEESDNFFAVEDIVDENDAYRVSSILERLALWTVALGQMSPDSIISVEMFDTAPLESPDINPDTPAVGWVHYLNCELDGDGSWEDWVNTHIRK